jgi:hypothetical protein
MTLTPTLDRLCQCQSIYLDPNERMLQTEHPEVEPCFFLQATEQALFNSVAAERVLGGFHPALAFGPAPAPARGHFVRLTNY